MDAETRAELAALKAQVATLQGKRDERRRGPIWRRRGAALVVAGLVALTPLIGMAANPTFNDLGTAAEVHRGNIQAIGNAGITTGFEDPANPGQRTYNPKGQVTREEMASFLARTAGLNGNPPIVNAQTAVTAASATTAQTALTVPDGSITTAKIAVAKGTIIGYLASEAPYPTPFVPANGIVVYLSGTNIRTVTNAEGRFTLEGVPVGTWAIQTQRRREYQSTDTPPTTIVQQCYSTIPDVQVIEGQVTTLPGYSSIGGTCDRLYSR